MTSVGAGKRACLLPALAAPLVLALTLLLPVSAAAAQPGGLNAEGCHNNRRTGDYHCRHCNADPASRPRALRQVASGGAFRNCLEACAAGVAPVRRGDPGFGAYLDRDDAGIGCE